MSHSSGLCRLPVEYRVAGLLNGERTAWFQTLAGRRPHAELAHLRPFPAHRTAASPLPFPMTVAASIQNGPKTSGSTALLATRGTEDSTRQLW